MHLSNSNLDRSNLARRAVINQRDDYGNTALHLASWNGSTESFKFLLENNADPVSA